MKYKNINSAIHNFGHSFLSFNNHVEGIFIIDDLIDIHKQKCDIEIDWINQKFKPNEFLSDRLKKSISYWSNDLKKHLDSHNVDIKAIKKLYFQWSFNQKKYMVAIDDRDMEYKIIINSRNK